MSVVLPFSLRKTGDTMKAGTQNEAQNKERNEESQTRSIILPAYVWEEIREDAQRCRRSVTKQIEAILVRYYKLESNVELDEDSLSEANKAVSHKRLKKAG